MLAAQESGLPVIGKVAAGSPILAQENVMATAAVDPATFKPYADYLLEVRGMSMRDAGILDGDWLAVHRQPQARSGQVVVARLGDEVTVKRLKLRGARAELTRRESGIQAHHRRLEARTFCNRRNCGRRDSGVALAEASALRRQVSVSIARAARGARRRVRQVCRRPEDRSEISPRSTLISHCVSASRDESASDHRRTSK